MHTLPYAANCSLLFRELPLLERPAAAAAAGFDAIELWWPWPTEPVPSDAEVDGLVTAVRDAGVRLVGLNLFADDLAGPDCGVVSIPDRAAALAENLPVVVAIAEQLGTRSFNALYGNRVDGVTPAEPDGTAVESLVAAAAAVAPLGGTVLVEPVSGPKPYPLRTADDVVAVLDRVNAAGADNVGFLCDLFHLANNGDDVAAAIARHGSRIAHVQVADLPGRHEPGTGHLDLEGQLAAIQAGGYAGVVALEYLPSTDDTLDSLTWLPRDRRGAHQHS